MRTVILGERPQALEALIESRQATGADLYDEVWEGDYHMNPAPRIPHAKLGARLAAVLGQLAPARGLDVVDAFNIGAPNDYRIPDLGVLRPGENGVYASTAALIVEIVSPDDESWDKVPFYAAHRVDEILIVDLHERRVVWLALDGDSYRQVSHSELLDVTVAEIAAQIDWPPLDG
jgi:Uma2 family endonuclease